MNEKQRIVRCGNSAVNLDRLLCVTLYNQQGALARHAMLAFDAPGAQSIAIPYEDAEFLLGNLKADGKPSDGTG